MNGQTKQSRPSENAPPSLHPKIERGAHDATAIEEEEEQSPSKAAGQAKGKSGNKSWRNLERRTSVASGRDRSIVSAGPLDNDSAYSSSMSGVAGDGPRLLTDSDDEMNSDEHEAFMFNMNGSRYTGIDLFDLEDSSSDDADDGDDESDSDDEEDKGKADDGPALIEGSAGSRIRVVLGATGRSFLLLIDEDDGTKQWQSKSWYGIPAGLAERLKDVEYVYQCSFSNNGMDWFLKARSAKTATTRSWWSVQSPAFHTAIATAIDGGLEVRVVFGSSCHDQYIVLLGPNGYTLGSHLPEGILAAMDQIHDAETTIARIRGLNAEGRFLMEELIDDENESQSSGISISTSHAIIRSVYHAKGLSPHLQRALETLVENQEIIWEISIGIDDSSWLIVRDDAWDGSVGIHDELALLLDRFYSRHAKRLEEQANRISVMTEERKLREQQRALAAAEERRNKSSNNNGNKGKKSEVPVRQEKTFEPKKSCHVPVRKKKEKETVPAKEKERREKETARLTEERRARRREKTLEQCKVAGKRREKEDRRHELAWKQLVTGDQVTVLGVSIKGGDVRIVDIDHSSGVVRIQLPRGLAKKKSKRDDNASVASGASGASSKSADHPVIPIHDTRRLTNYVAGGDALSDSTELASLVLASDKYEAAVMLYHSYCEMGACACKRKFYGYSQRNVQYNQLKLGDRVHVIGYADATIIQSSEDYVRKDLIHVQYDDQSTYHVNASQLRPIQELFEIGSCRFLEAQTPADERALRIRPFYDALTPKNQEAMYRFDDYTCREKIDLRRLQSLADDLRRDSAVRRQMLADFQRQVEDHTESSKFEVCYNTLEKCRDLEETIYSLFETLKGFPCDQDGHLQHEVQYRHKDVGQRGRLFAVGRSVRILQDSFPRTLTIQGIQGELIGPLTGAFCHYVDCVNSDIQLLCSLGKQTGVESLIPTITDYRNFRDKWLEAIHHEHPDTSPDEVKRLVNIILFGGSYDSWLKQVGEDPASKVKRFAFRLHAETRAIRDQLLNHPRFQWVEQERHELEQKGLTGETVKMVLFQRILHSCENVVLGIVHRTFHNCGWRVRAKLFDAVLVERGPMVEQDLDRTIAMAQQSCSSMGWDVTLVEKSLFGRQHDPLGTIVDARTIVSAVQAATAGGQPAGEFWVEPTSSGGDSSTNDTNHT